MTTRNVSFCIFYEEESRNIIIQERDNHSKVGEKYGFWGGGILKGESKELMECKVNEGKSMIEMNIDKAIEQKNDFLEDTIDILETL